MGGRAADSGDDNRTIACKYQRQTGRANGRGNVNSSYSSESGTRCGSVKDLVAVSDERAGASCRRQG